MGFVKGLLAGTGAFGVIIYIGLLIASIYGWINNIFLLVASLNGPINAMFVARIVGIPVAVLGAVLGFIN